VNRKTGLSARTDAIVCTGSRWTSRSHGPQLADAHNTSCRVCDARARLQPQGTRLTLHGASTGGGGVLHVSNIACGDMSGAGAHVVVAAVPAASVVALPVVRVTLRRHCTVITLVPLIVILPLPLPLARLPLPLAGPARTRRSGCVDSRRSGRPTGKPPGSGRHAGQQDNPTPSAAVLLGGQQGGEAAGWEMLGADDARTSSTSARYAGGVLAVPPPAPPCCGSGRIWFATAHCVAGAATARASTTTSQGTSCESVMWAAGSVSPES
jgi:hypothetical protein